MNTKLHFFKNYLTLKNFYLICMLLATTIATAKSNNITNTQVSLSLKNALITDVFSAIENQTAYTFIFDNSITEIPQKVSINSTNEDLQTILKKITKQSGFQFKILNHTITVLSSDKQKIIKGKVIDESGFPLPGASVIEKGINNGTSTDFDGLFSFALTTDNAELEISFVGYITKTIKAIPGTLLEIKLQENVNSLNEVVVTALGIKREEKRLGFSQATVGSESLAQTAPNNWSSGLKGKVAGLNIVSSGSGPMNSQQITLRGNNS